MRYARRRSWMTTLSLWVVPMDWPILFVILLFVGAAQGQDGRRPDVYPSGWPQFSVCEYKLDPRIVCSLRLGAGPDRKAELLVLELVDDGQRLRVLHTVTLRNAYSPMSWNCLGAGRFVVTTNEFDASGKGANCLVVYDLVVGSSRAWDLTDFLSEKAIGALPSMDFDLGKRWLGACSWYDRDKMIYFLSSPEDCREHHLPFVVLDLRSAKVTTPVCPTRLEAGVATLGRMDRLVWTAFSTDADEHWDRKGLQPTYLKAEGVGKLDSAAREYLGIRDEQAVFRITPDGKNYVRCPSEEWLGDKAKK